jgi:hypothetical protein
MNPLSPINPQVIREGLMVELNKENAEKYDFDLKNALTWSRNNELMHELFVKAGYDRNSTTNRAFVSKYYTELIILKRGITHMSSQLHDFKNLKHLDVSYNNIRHVCYLPENLEEFIAQKNQIVTISRNVKLDSLKYINLSCNPLHDRSLENINSSFPNLKCLDLSYGHLSNVQYTLALLILMKKLRMLYLLGNPFTLLRGYVELIKSEVPNIKYLDGKLTKLEKDAGQDNVIKTYGDLLKQQQDTIEAAKNPEVGQVGENKASASRSDVLSSRSSKDAYNRRLTNMLKRGGSNNEFGSELMSHGDFKFDINLSVRTLEGVKSVNLDDPDVPEDPENPNPNKKESKFWFDFNMFDQRFSSKFEPVAHSKTMKQEKDDTLSNLDFAWTQQFTFELTAELYKNIMKGFYIEVWQSQPHKEVIDETDEAAEPQIIIKEELLGFVIVNLDDFIGNSSLTTLRKKLPIFEEKELLRYPNAYWPDKKETELIEKNAAAIEKIRKDKQPVVKEEIVGADKVLKGKDAKKAPGKPAPSKAPPKGKDAKPVEETPAVAQLDWAEDGRNVIAVKGDHLGRKEFADDLKFFVAAKPVLAVQVTFG